MQLASKGVCVCVFARARVSNLFSLISLSSSFSVSHARTYMLVSERIQSRALELKRGKGGGGVEKCKGV